jgi:Protein of unknown function (DUF3168)
MPGFNTADLQSAIFAALVNDAPLATKITAVYDEPPGSAIYPYVTTGDGETEDLSGKTETLTGHTFIINIWSDAAGRMETKEIMDQVHAALHLSDLTLGSGTLVYLRFVSAEDIRDDDSGSVLYHGIMKFKVLTGE